MKTFIILTELTEEGKKAIQNDPAGMKLSAQAIENRGGILVDQFALLGPWDFLTIIKAKDEKTIFRITTELDALGTVKTMTLPAMPIEEFIDDIITSV
ncbi:GYD domain-containing protein [Desulfoluna spongiiphila]|uniref:GYD domain-containing protein n=1 Tax=Desulfoluna spongiiphila TaxID=419481 RepID=UPI0012592DB2|nr:GYD domain-containing protein [Desulfoluna spongiiphila]VVS93652.1 protein gyd/ttha1554 [Desulfoluna spongiiphila]